MPGLQDDPQEKPERRADQLATLTELLPWPHEAAVTLVDLGAGFGALTERILACYPLSQITCVDGSVEMLALARERLAPYGSRVQAPSCRSGR